MGAEIGASASRRAQILSVGVQWRGEYLNQRETKMMQKSCIMRGFIAFTLHQLFGSIRVIKSRRTKWAGHAGSAGGREREVRN